MFKSVYKKIRDDFAFLSNYGYLLKKEMKHNEAPSIIFEKNNIDVRIGFDFRINRIYVFMYDLSESKFYEYTDLLENKQLEGKSYNDQVEEAKKVVREYLENNH